MSSREVILGKIRKNKPSTPTVNVDLGSDAGIDTYNEFKESVAHVGGKIVEIKSINDWKTWIRITYGTELNVYSEIDAIEGNYLLEEQINKNQLNSINNFKYSI